MDRDEPRKTRGACQIASSAEAFMRVLFLPIMEEYSSARTATREELSAVMTRSINRLVRFSIRTAWLFSVREILVDFIKHPTMRYCS
jgi:hypothetical protein